MTILLEMDLVRRDAAGTPTGRLEDAQVKDDGTRDVVAGDRPAGPKKVKTLICSP